VLNGSIDNELGRMWKEAVLSFAAKHLHGGTEESLQRPKSLFIYHRIFSEMKESSIISISLSRGWILGKE
jgi:hypothetical protein